MAFQINKYAQIAFLLLVNLAVSGCYTNSRQRNTNTAPPVNNAYQLAIVGANSANIGDCSALQVQVQNSAGAQLAAGVDTQVVLAHTGAGSFYAEAACTTAIGGLILPANTTSKTFYYRSMVAQSDSLTASDVSGTLLSANFSLLIDGAVKLVLVGPGTIGTNQCRQFSVQAQNSSNVARTVAQNVLVNLTGGGSGSFYSDATCATSAPGVTIPAGFHTASFFYRASSPQSLFFAANDNAGTLAGGVLSVVVDGPTQLDLTGPTQLYANQCGSYTIQTLNGASQASPVTADTVLNFSASSGSFYSDSNCATVVSQRMLVTGNSQITVYFRKTTAGASTLGVNALGLGSDSLALFVNGANQLTLTGLDSIFAGRCEAYSLNVNGAVIAAMPISLSGQGNGSFYSNASCSNPITSATIPVGNTSVTFYYRANSGQLVTLRGTPPASTPFIFAERAVTVSGARSLALMGSSSIGKNVCEQYSIQARDNSNLPAPVASSVIASLSNSGAGIFYANSSCTSAITQAVIPAGSSSVNFYFKSASNGSNLVVAGDVSGILGNASAFVDVASLIAVLSISDAPTYSFGEIAAGNSLIHTFSLSNTGTASATSISEAMSAALATPFDFVGGAYPGTNGTCGSSLAVGASCTMRVVYAPVALGLFQDELTLQYHNGEETVLVARAMVGVSNTSIINGVLDDSFSGDGILTHNLSAPSELIHGIVVQPSGKIVVVGTAENPLYDDWDFVLARYHSDGSLDTSFGTNGVTYTDFRGGDDNAYAVALQSDGKIIAVGRSQNSSGGNQSIALARYSANGILDTSFGGSTFNGKIYRRVGTTQNLDELNGVSVDSSGRIVVAGRADNNMIVARFLSSGSLDTSFGGASGTGIVKFAATVGPNSALAMKLQSDGKILATGYAADQSFSSSGILTVRLTASGSLDTSFSSDGYVLTPMGSAVDMGRSIAIDSLNRIVVVGATSNTIGSYNIAILRYTSSGSLDGSFDADGKKITSVGSNPSVAEAVVIQADDKIVIAGYNWIQNTSSGDRFIVARYGTDGFLDTTFFEDGALILSGGRAHAITLQNDGKILAAGESSGRFAVVRILP